MKVIEIIGGAYFILLGLAMALFCKRLARFSDEFYAKLHIPHVNEPMLKLAFAIAGALSLAFGLLLMFGVIK